MTCMEGECERQRDGARETTLAAHHHHTHRRCRRRSPLPLGSPPPHHRGPALVDTTTPTCVHLPASSHPHMHTHIHSRAALCTYAFFPSHRHGARVNIATQRVTAAVFIAFHSGSHCRSHSLAATLPDWYLLVRILNIFDLSGFLFGLILAGDLPITTSGATWAMVVSCRRLAASRCSSLVTWVVATSPSELGIVAARRLKHLPGPLPLSLPGAATSWGRRRSTRTSPAVRHPGDTLGGPCHWAATVVSLGGGCHSRPEAARSFRWRHFTILRHKRHKVLALARPPLP